jgi:hypothetical protein
MFLFIFAGFPEIDKNEGTIVPKTNKRNGGRDLVWSSG